MFIVATLTGGRDRSQMESRKKLYTSPIVWHLGAILVLSGAALAPTVSARCFGLLTTAVAIIGTAFGIRIAVGIARAQLAASYSGYDVVWYGVGPALTYLALALSGAAFLDGDDWGIEGVAAALMVLLLVSIHNEWDLVTFLAPDAPNVSGGESKE